MDENIKSPIDQLAYLLGSMTARALEAERERDAAKMDAENWYQSYSRKNEQLEECRSALDAEIAKHNETREKLRAYIAEMEKGVAENDAEA